VQRVDEAVAKANASVNIPMQSGRSIVAPGKRTTDTQAEAPKPPRVMMGSADRIENLWPRN